MSEERTYESAVARLEEIISRLDSGDAQLRETLDLCGEAKTMIEFCAAELSAVDEGLKELKLEDLAESLSSDPEAALAPNDARPPDAESAAGSAAEAPSADDDVPF